MDLTVHFHYCITLPITHTALKKVYHTVNFNHCTALSIIRNVIKNQAFRIHKYRSYNRNLREGVGGVVTWHSSIKWQQLSIQ